MFHNHHFLLAASIHSLAGPVGAFISGPIMDKFGRRPCLMISTLPVIACWLIIGTAASHTSLLIGRFLGGMSTGLMGAASQVCHDVVYHS